jgi:hypothetical protein
MTGLRRSPRLTRAGLVLIDPQSGSILRLITLQYTPEKLTRSLAVKAQADDGDRSRALRIAGPAVETFQIEAELDATDQLEFPESHPAAVDAGLFPQLTALEALVYPTTSQLQSRNSMAAAGTLEIAPMEAPLALFVWSRHRIVPVRVTELSITEEGFDPTLNPVFAKISLGLRVLSVDDLGFQHRGGSLFMAYLAAKEGLAKKSTSGLLSSFGLESVS